MKDSWICRGYQRGDEYQILTLYKEVNDREMPLDYWKWKFAKNPFGEAVIKLMFDGDELFGHYAVIPMNVQIQKKLVKAALSVNAMTHADYRGHGIFTYLGKEAYKVCKQKGMAFMYAFPNNNSYQAFVKKLGWKGFGKMSVLQKELKNGVTARPKAKNIYEVSEFDDEVNSLWDKVRADYHVIVPRTKEFLNWRFAQHPTVDYSRYIVRDDDNVILGYMVLKIYTKGEETKGHIVDMLCVNKMDIVKSLLDRSYDYFVKKDVRGLSCWMPDGCFCTQVLKEEGFVRQEFETNFGVKTLDKETRLLQDVEQFNNWHLTMGDSDVF